MNRKESFIEKVYRGIGAAAMGLLAVMVIFTVIMRYCFSQSWKSVSEFNVTLFAFTTFWGMGINVLRGEHVFISILFDSFKPGVKKIMTVFDLAVMLVVDCLFVYYSWGYAAKMGQQISQGMEIPMLYMYGIMPVCGILCAVCIVVKIIEAVRAPKSAYEPVNN